MNEHRTGSNPDTGLTQPRSLPVPAGEVIVPPAPDSLRDKAGEFIAEAVSVLMDAGVHPSEIRKHLQTETAWIDREMARVDAPSWSA